MSLLDILEFRIKNMKVLFNLNRHLNNLNNMVMYFSVSL